MQIIRTAAEAASIADPELRHLIQKTIHDLSPDGSYDPEVLDYCLIVDPKNDTLAAINTKLGFDILANRWTGKRFGDADFTPSFELVADHGGYWEMVYVLDQAGGGVLVFVEKPASTTGKQGGNAVGLELAAMCVRYATPAQQP